MAHVEVPDWPPYPLPSRSRARIIREHGTWRNLVKRGLFDTAGALSVGDDEAALVGLARTSTLIDELIREEVARSREGDLPLSWAEVGAALGVTKQAAQQRYGVKSD